MTQQQNAILPAPDLDPPAGGSYVRQPDGQLQRQTPDPQPGQSGQPNQPAQE